MTTDRCLVYLACPYTGTTEIEEQRFHAVNRAASRLMREGEMVFSPISHTHPIVVDGGVPKDWRFWEQYDRALLRCCHKVYVLRLDGWQESVGVTAEIQIAKDMGISIEYLEASYPDGDDRARIAKETRT